MLHPSFTREQTNDTLAALRLAPIEPVAILAAKIAANFCFLLLAELMLLPIFAALYNLQLAAGARAARGGVVSGHAGAGHHRHGIFSDLLAGAHARIAAAAAAAAGAGARADRERGSHRRPV